MPKAASGGGGSTAQPSLWGSGGGSRGDRTPRSYDSGGSSKPTTTYTATGGTKPDIEGFRYPTGESVRGTPMSVPSVVQGPPPAAPGPVSKRDIGSFSVDTTTPEGLAQSLREDAEQANSLFAGLNRTIFGADGQGGLPLIAPLAGALGGAGDALFGQGNNSLLGGTVVGDAVRQAGGAVQGVAQGTGGLIGGVVGGVLDTASTIAEHVPIEAVPFVGLAEGDRLRSQFAAIPDSPEKRAIQERIEGDPLGAGHLRSAFVRQYVEEQQRIDPVLVPELATAPGSLGDALTSMLGLVAAPVKPIERLVAGAGKADGLNRLQAIEQVVLGKSRFSSGPEGVTEVEQHAYDMWSRGLWSADQALTFLAASNTGFSHDPMHEVLAQVAFDPTVWGSVGAAGMAKLGLASRRIAAAPVGELLRAPGTANKYNVLGRLAETEGVSKKVASIGKRVYTPMQENVYGQAAKMARTIIDPLHVVGGHRVAREAAVDIATESAIRVVDSAGGHLAANQVLADMHGLGLLDAATDAKATYATGLARETMLKGFVDGVIEHTLGHRLQGLTPSKIADSLMSHAPRDWADLVKAQAVAVRKTLWRPEDYQNLAGRMETFFGKGSADEWLARFKGKSTDYLAQLHAMTYGKAVTEHLNVIGKAITEVGNEAAAKLKLPRFILINQGTMTDLGAQGIVRDVEAALAKAGGKFDDVIKLVKDRQALYSELNYYSIDPVDPERSIQRLVAGLRKQVADGTLPGQLTDEELAKMPQVVRDHAERIHGSFTLGFRPEDDKLFGLVWDTEGRFSRGFAPWSDHVAVKAPPYRGIQAVRYNAAGMPLIGEPLGKTIDYLDAGARTLRARVSAATISEAARTRFMASAMKNIPGATERELNDIYEAVQDAAKAHETTPRGLSADNMWEKAKVIIEDRLRFGVGEGAKAMTPRDLMTLIVHAYEGDLRFVGLTQKFTGRAKTILAEMTGSNFAGEFSETMYNRIKFKYNLIFQTQERIEGWVLNGMSGSNPALGTTLKETDRMILRQYENLRKTGVIRSTDIGQAEFHAYNQIGGGLADEIGRRNPTAFNELKNVRGSKRINEIRRYAHTMGRSMREIFNKGEDGLWDRIVTHYSDQAGYLMSDDEVAARYIAGQVLSGDVTVQSVIRPGESAGDFINAVSTAEWFRPTNLGEVKGLNLDYMTSVMDWTTADGKSIRNVGELRAALNDRASGMTIERVSDALRGHGVHADYVKRVENALNFHWDGFWTTAAEKFNASPREIKRLQLMMEESARVRGMTAVDYMSQVFSPTIDGGPLAALDAMESHLSILRTSGASTTPEDLAYQMADAFRHHLDPSGREGVIRAFEKDLPKLVDSSMRGRAPVRSRQLQETLDAFRGELIEGAPKSAAERVAWQEEHSRAFGQSILDRLDEMEGVPVEPVKPGFTRLYRVETTTLPPPRSAADEASWRKALGEQQYAQSQAERGRLFSEVPHPDYGHGVPGHTTYSVDVPSDVAAGAKRIGFKGNDPKQPFAEFLLPSDLVASKRPVRIASSGGGMTRKEIKASSTNPDLDRAVQQFSKWSQQTLGQGLLGDNPKAAELLTRVTGIPTEHALPFNQMEALLVNQVTHAQRMATEDAFRLQYFARNRSFVERSLNHPFFGIYPASYMWGKILPEMAKFMAIEPFGMRTGAAMNMAHAFQTSVATQRELDPAFQEKMDSLGSGSVAWGVGYMMPSLPWDVGAGATGGLRNLAAQGLENQRRVDKGLEPNPIDLLSALQDVGDYISPFRPIKQASYPLEEIGDFIAGGTPGEKREAELARKRQADKVIKLDRDVARAKVAYETALSRQKVAKTPSAKARTAAAVEVALRDVQLAETALRTQVDQGDVPETPDSLETITTNAFNELSGILFGR